MLEAYLVNDTMMLITLNFYNNSWYLLSSTGGTFYVDSIFFIKCINIG